MKKICIVFITVLISTSGFSQTKNLAKFYFGEKDSVDVAVSEEIKLGSLLVYQKLKKLISKKFKEPYGYKSFSFYNNKNICRIVLYPELNNYFIKSIELINKSEERNISKDFIKYNGVFKTNQFNISLNDSIDLIINKFSQAKLNYVKVEQGGIACLKIEKVFKAELNDITFENANYLAEYYFQNSILTRIKISYPSN